MKTLAFLIFLAPTLFAYGQTKNPFLSLKFDKVIMYDFKGTGEKELIIVDGNGKFHQAILKQVQLDKKTIEKVNTRLGDRRSYGNGTAACFDPHCGFVYFLNNKIVGQIIICLSCNRLHSTIDIPAQKQGKYGQGNETYYIRDGLSKSFRKFINGLLVKNKFANQIEPGAYFDK